MANSSAEGSRPLARQLGLWSAVAVLIGSTIGSGIFRSPAGIADKLPGPLPLLAVWATGGLFALCGALTLAEIAGALPHTGGLYVFIREGGAAAGLPLRLGEFMSHPRRPLGAIATRSEYSAAAGLRPGAGRTRLCTTWRRGHRGYGAINYGGLRWGSLSEHDDDRQVRGLLFHHRAGAAIGLRATGGQLPRRPSHGQLRLRRLRLALVSALWPFDGLGRPELRGRRGQRTRAHAAARADHRHAGRDRRLHRRQPRLLAVLSVEEIRTSRLVAADVAQRLVGPAGVVFVAVTVMLSTFGTLNGSLLTAPRIFFAMADDGLFFPPGGPRAPRGSARRMWPSPCRACLGIAFVLLRTFEQLADAFVTAIVPFYALGVASIFVLRGRPGYDPPFRVPGYPVVPALFVLASIYLLVNAIVGPGGALADARPCSARSRRAFPSTT
jgi:hypothetical protein